MPKFTVTVCKSIHVDSEVTLVCDSEIEAGEIVYAIVDGAQVEFNEPGWTLTSRTKILGVKEVE